MISYANSKDLIQSLFSYSPFRFFIQRIDITLKDDNTPTITTYIFSKYDDLIVEKLLEVGFTKKNDTISYIYSNNQMTYHVDLLDSIESKRQYMDIFSDLNFISYEEENQFFDHVKSVDDGTDIFYKNYRETIKTREDALIRLVSSF